MSNENQNISDATNQFFIENGINQAETVTTASIEENPDIPQPEPYNQVTENTESTELYSCNNISIFHNMPLNQLSIWVKILHIA